MEMQSGKAFEQLRALLSKAPLVARRPLPEIQLPKVAKKIVERYQSIEIRPPRPQDLLAVRRELIRLYREQKSLDAAPLQLLRKAPYVLYWPPDEEALGDDVEFMRAYVQAIKRYSPLPALLIRSLLYVYLRDFPVGRPAFELLRQLVERLLSSSNRSTLTVWKERMARHALLESEQAPERWAFRHLGSATPPGTLLADAGLTGELALGQFVRRIYRALCQQLHQKGLSRQLRINELEWVLQFATNESRLRFPDEPAPLAEALLLPYEKQDPPPDIQERTVQFLLEYLKDPRVHPWLHVKPQAVRIFTRWLVKLTLEDFFRVIDETAKERHWKYRRHFWLAYYQEGLIDDAYAAFGPQARAIARHIVEQRYGILQGGSGNQSLLLIKIGNLTFAEWSHDGACRVWTDPDKAPKLGQKIYYRTEIMENPYSQRIAHRNSEEGQWQWKLATLIQQHTKRTVPSRKYMPHG